MVKDQHPSWGPPGTLVEAEKGETGLEAGQAQDWGHLWFPIT